MVVAQDRAREGERSTILHPDAPASGLVARLRLRILDEKARRRDGGIGIGGEEPDIVVAAEDRAREGERGTLQHHDAPASGLVTGIWLGVLDEEPRGVDSGSDSKGPQPDVVVVAEGDPREGERSTL